MDSQKKKKHGHYEGSTMKSTSSSSSSYHLLAVGTLLFIFALCVLPNLMVGTQDESNNASTTTTSRSRISSWPRVRSGITSSNKQHDSSSVANEFNNNNNSNNSNNNNNKNRRGLLLDGEQDLDCSNFVLPPDVADHDNDEHQQQDQEGLFKEEENKDNGIEIGEKKTSTTIMEQDFFRCEPNRFEHLCQAMYHHDSCQCQNPTIGDPMHNSNGYPRIGDRWEKSFAQQRERVANRATDPDSNPPVDVVFIGDSITEHWIGESLGDVDDNYDGIHDIFQKQFTKAGGGKVEGLVLAISGERTWNVLYRLENNALGDDGDDDDENNNNSSLNPKVFWLNIGTNDLGGECCTTENILAGNIAIVRQLQTLRPDATIVINGVLPRGKGFDDSIIPLNEGLACFAEATSGVEYFGDSDAIFANPDRSTKNLQDGLHPTTEGHQLWSEAILDRLAQIIDFDKDGDETKDNDADKSDNNDEDEDESSSSSTSQCGVPSAENSNGTCDEARFDYLCKGYFGHTSCICQDPTVGDPMHNGNGFPLIGDRWEAAFAQQQQRVADLLANPDHTPVDVVFLGDSITEHWMGEGLGDHQDKFDGIHAVYEKQFTKAGGGQVEGLVLGISGETTWNVLYRLQNNALGDEEYEGGGKNILDPKVFWLLIGTNDLGGRCCSWENILAGNIAIVKEVQSLRPDATVVINGVLPRGQQSDDAIVPLNEGLACFADVTPGVEYFGDSDYIFSNPDRSVKNLADGLHPNEEGSQLWSEAILDRLAQIFDFDDNGGEIDKGQEDQAEDIDNQDESISSSSSSNSDGEGEVDVISNNDAEESSRCDEEIFESLCTLHGQTTCMCQDPTVGASMHNSQTFPKLGDRWATAFAQQLQRVAGLSSNPESPLVDVVFLGDAITEHWAGEAMGEVKEEYEGINTVFQQLFTKAGGSPIEGLVLAISAEETWNVLYRLQHDVLGGANDINEEGDNILNPKVFWLTIGTNNVSGDCCNSENIIVGNIAIVEELQSQRPDATVVINGILPRGQLMDRVIVAVNEGLAAYADATPGVEYFGESDTIFATPDRTTTMHLVDEVYPDEEGYRLWGEAILERLSEIIGFETEDGTRRL